MIVVAIIGILAAIAIPAYQDYTIRAQVSEGLVLASGAKTAMAEFYSQTGRFPTGTGANESLGLEDPTDILGSYVSAVNAGIGTDGGVIEVTYGRGVNAQVDGDQLNISAVTSAGSMRWTCTPGTTAIDSKYLPTNCR
jgi:type IV pilus assembly protein PilA